MTDPLSVKREFIGAAMKRAQDGHYPVVDPTPEDNKKDLAWWLKVLDAKSFLFSENGSAAWLFPHYQLKLSPISQRVVVSFAGTTLVDSRRCFEFFETAHPVQIYIPKSEIDFAFLRDSDTLTYCPFKNIARYYHVQVGVKTATDAFWSYEDVYRRLPSDGQNGITAICGLLSPDRTKVDVTLSDD